MPTLIEWNQFYLPNVPLYDIKLPDFIVSRLWDYVKKSEKKMNYALAGNIAESLELIDEDDYFFNMILKPMSVKYISENPNIRQFQSNHTTESELYLSKLWVNYQYKHEFNPMHSHLGVISFVIWMKIPTKAKDQHNLPIAKNSNSPSASDFSFAYTDILGNIHDYKIQQSPSDNGTMIIFPAGLNHQVYPFYECDEKRISISGNIRWK